MIVDIQSIRKCFSRRDRCFAFRKAEVHQLPIIISAFSVMIFTIIVALVERDDIFTRFFEDIAVWGRFRFSGFCNFYMVLPGRPGLRCDRICNSRRVGLGEVDLRARNRRNRCKRRYFHGWLQLRQICAVRNNHVNASGRFIDRGTDRAIGKINDAVAGRRFCSDDGNLVLFCCTIFCSNRVEVLISDL